MAKQTNEAADTGEHPSDSVFYDSYGGVSTDLAKWLQTKAGQKQLNALKDLETSDKTTSSTPKR
jgi:hypothetical protein